VQNCRVPVRPLDSPPSTPLPPPRLVVSVVQVTLTSLTADTNLLRACTAQQDVQRKIIQVIYILILTEVGGQVKPGQVLKSRLIGRNRTKLHAHVISAVQLLLFGEFGVDEPHRMRMRPPAPTDNMVKRTYFLSRSFNFRKGSLAYVIIAIHSQGGSYVVPDIAFSSPHIETAGRILAKGVSV